LEKTVLADRGRQLGQFVVVQAEARLLGVGLDSVNRSFNQPARGAYLCWLSGF
jgi:hypothetical protein